MPQFLAKYGRASHSVRMEITPHTDSTLESIVPDSRLLEWIEGATGLPYRTLPGVELDRWCRFHADRVRQAVADDASRVTVGRSGNDAQALAVVKPLPWDTEVLGRPVFSLEYLLFDRAADVDAVVEVVRAAVRGIDSASGSLLYKTSSADVPALAAIGRAGFDLLTIHLDHLFDTKLAAEGSHDLDGYEFGEAREDEVEAIGEVSAHNYALTDRFTVDPLVPPERVPEVYRQWAMNSVRGFADLVWVARRDGVPVGFGTWSIQRGLAEATGVTVAWNGLASVASSERNRGLFRRIKSGALAELHRRGVPWVCSPTNVLNIPTQRCFASVGAYNYAPILTYRLDLARS